MLYTSRAALTFGDWMSRGTRIRSGVEQMGLNAGSVPGALRSDGGGGGGVGHGLEGVRWSPSRLRRTESPHVHLRSVQVRGMQVMVVVVVTVRRASNLVRGRRRNGTDTGRRLVVVVVLLQLLQEDGLGEVLVQRVRRSRNTHHWSGHRAGEDRRLILLTF